MGEWEGAEGGRPWFVIFVGYHAAFPCMCGRRWEACFWCRVAIFEWAIGWVVVGVVASVGKDAEEGGTIFVDGSFREEKDVGAVGGDDGDEMK